MQLNFAEIENDDQFENLVAQYFEDLQKSNKDYPQIRNVEVIPPGKGTDGGKDTIVTFTINDTVVTYYKKWVVQCKFYNTKAVSPAHLSDNNIPTLVHSYGANGYLLVCSGNITSKLVDLFDRLERECVFKYKYQIWNGDKFRGKIMSSSNELLRNFFPKYFSFSQQTLHK